jgi:hypothetical protein
MEAGSAVYGVWTLCGPFCLESRGAGIRQMAGPTAGAVGHDGRDRRIWGATTPKQSWTLMRVTRAELPIRGQKEVI